MANKRSDNPAGGQADRGRHSGHGSPGGHGKRGGHGGGRPGRGGRHGRKEDRPMRHGAERSHEGPPAAADEPSPDAWFMGHDRRTVKEIVATDAGELARAGLTAEKAAQILQKVLDSAMAAMGAEVDFAGGRLKAVCRESMGKLPCPLASCGLLAKGQVELTDTQTGRIFLIAPLSVHLIANHRFLQGRGSDYRIEPEDLAQLVKLLG
ncbi:MAG: hypothetical protein HZA50_04515 [Planctomycetes bacterium]|nr:hypothetical protein [Planctomycetota bacterium]